MACFVLHNLLSIRYSVGQQADSGGEGQPAIVHDDGCNPKEAAKRQRNILPSGVDILFLFFPASALRHAWFPVISRKSIYPMFTTFGMGVYWVNSLHAIAFGEDNSIAN